LQLGGIKGFSHGLNLSQIMVVLPLLPA